MLNKILDAFESITATVISGVALTASLTLSFFNIELEPAWIAVIISGIPILSSAIKKLLNKKGIEKISSALLISIAMVSSVIIGDVFAAGEVAFIMAIGEILEDKTTDRAKKGLKKLISLVPNKARLLKNGNETIIDAKEIKVGDIIRILPGETIAVDGEILNGNTSIDQSVITGESLPIDKTVGDSVFCGTINRFGSVDIKATKVGSDSTLQKLISMVKEAENKKAPMQRIADKWAGILVPVALLLAILGGVLTNDIIVAVTVLVVFCPCALVLATPTAIMAAIGQATKHGVIIKSGEALEKMGRVNTIAFDKTGTLTLGTLSVSDVISFSELTENELLTIAASAESKSEHPLGKAIVENARSKDLILLESQDFIMEAGKGVSANVNGKTVLCGNEKFVLSDSISLCFYR